jgi:hypothetical protein
MVKSLVRRSVLIDPGDEDHSELMLKGLRAGNVPNVDPEEVARLMARVEDSIKGGRLAEAEETMRKALLSVAACEADVGWRREIARECADALAIVRPRIGLPPAVHFADVTLDGTVHMYAFEIAKETERARLVSVVADREVAHDGGFVAGLPEDDVRHGAQRRLRSRGTALKRRGPTRNGPCPCGSGRKYKGCCGRGR